MIKKSFNYCKSIFSDKTYKLGLAYMIIGCVAFLISSLEISYFNYIYYALVHPYLITFFIFPVIFFNAYRVQKRLDNDSGTLLYLENRKRVVVFSFLNTLIIVSITYFYFIFISVIFANIFGARQDFVVADPNYSEINNIIGMLFNFFKLYIFLVAYTLLSLSVMSLRHKIKFVYLFILLFGLFTINGHLDIDTNISWILPYQYIGVAYIFNSFLDNLLYSSIYNILIFILSCFSFTYILRNKSLGGN